MFRVCLFRVSKAVFFVFFLSLGLFSPLKSRAFAWKERERESPSRVASLLDAKKGGGVVGVGVGVVARQKKKREREREREREQNKKAKKRERDQEVKLN